MRGSDFIFHCVHLLSNKCHKIYINLYIQWIIYKFSWWDKKAIINPINKKDNKCFQYDVTVALNHEEIK